MNLVGYSAAKDIGNNLAGGFRQVRDENAIEKILADAHDSGDPSQIQNAIGKILSQVSPERQPMAIKYLQNAYENVMERRKELKTEQQELRKETEGKKAAKEAGYTYGAPAQVAAAQVKEKAKSGRLAQYGLGSQPTQSSSTEKSTQPLDQNPQPSSEPIENVFRKLTDDQLVLATGAPDREVSEPAKAEYQRRKDERERELKIGEDERKFGIERARKVLDEVDKTSLALPQRESALGLLEDAIVRNNPGFFSGDNLAEITGLEGFRSKEGAIFKTAGKEYFLGNISRAGARPNQWIEQQIADMMAKIGRSTAANLSTTRALKNEIAIDKERVNLSEQIYDEIRKDKKDYGKLPGELNRRLSDFAEKKQKELFNDLRAIKAIDESSNQKFMKVEPGTKVSSYMVDALLKMFDNDPKKAKEEAKKLGYSFE